MILSVANLKGGVGKTTLCYHLAYLFTRKNFQTLLIDIDPQGNLTSCYLSTPPDTSNHVKRLFENEIPTPIKINENLHLVASSIELSKYESQIKLESYFRLKAYLELPEVKKKWNVVLIDTPPALNIFTSNALIVSQYVLCIVDPGDFAILGYKEVKDIILDVVKKINPDAKLIGLVFNMVKPKTRNFKTIYQKCIETFGNEVFTNYIRYSTAIRDALSKRQPIFEYNKLHPACKEFENVFEELMKRVNASNLA